MSCVSILPRRGIDVPLEVPDPRAERQPPPRIQIEHAEPIVDCGRYPAKRTAARPSPSRPTSSVTATRCCAPSCASAARRDGAGTRRRCATSTPPTRASLGGIVRRRPPGRWTFTSRRGPTRSRRGAGARPQGRRRHRGPVRRAVGGRAAARGRCGLAEGADRERSSTRSRRARHDRADAHPHDAALALDLRRRASGRPTARSRRCCRSRSSSTSTASAPASAPGTSCSRARGAASRGSRALPRLAELGFDVLYLPPIHPIGVTNRKGPNNALVAGPGDPGSPWAIGHTTRRPRRDPPGPGHARRLRPLVADGRRTASRSPRLRDPVLGRPPVAHRPPEWFNRRPDGTLKYAENPPKKYQDIYNVNWQSEDWRHLWQALLDVVLFWVTTACASSASTTRTRSRSRSGSG